MHKITFPHMGTLYIPARTLLESLGLEAVVPPFPTRKTLNLGVEGSPEFACLPLKINMGNYREAMAQGADAILMAGGVGPCRFGYYAHVQREILRDLGYTMDMIIIEPPKGSWVKFYREIRGIIGPISWGQIWQAGKTAWKKAVVVDDMEKRTQFLRAVEVQPGSADRHFVRGLKAVDDADTESGIARAWVEWRNESEAIPRISEPPVRIALVGEIYTILEPFSNFEIEKRLGRLGVHVIRKLFLSEWVREHLVPGPLKPHQEIEALYSAAKPFLRHFVGGHGLESVGHTVQMAQEVDGVIQLAPLTCMPEIVAESILPVVSRELKIPVLTLFVDEHTAEAGLVTRLEAFVDLVKRRKRTQNPGKRPELTGFFDEGAKLC